MNIKDHTGETLHGLELLKRIPRPGNHDGASYEVKCLRCNRIYTISYKSILHSKGDYCGLCRNSDAKKSRRTDFTGQRFGSLVAIKYIDSFKTTKGNSTPYWLYKCDCGNEVVLEAQSIKKRQRCCGRHCPYNQAKINGNPKGFIPIQQDVNLHKTNIQHKDYTKPPSNNKSGYPGVWYNKKFDKYCSYITFRKKRYHLGTYKDIDEAIRVRKHAEKQIFGEFIDWYNKFKEVQSNENDS